MKAIETQVGGDHYKDNGIQPFEMTLANFGYEGLRAAVYTKVNKYLIRNKNSHIEDIKKAIHCLEIQLEAAQAEDFRAVWSEERDKVCNRIIEDSEGWIKNTGVDPELKAKEYEVMFDAGDSFITAMDSYHWSWVLSERGDCITHYRPVKNTGDNKVDG